MVFLFQRLQSAFRTRLQIIPVLRETLQLKAAWKESFSIDQIFSKASKVIFDFPGIFHTLTLPVKIGPNLFKDALFVGLNTNLTYLVFIHAPEFFFFNDNPLSTPAIIKRFKTKPNSWSFRLELTEVNKLNLPSSPCADDPSYNFLSCMRKSVASKVQRRNIAKGTTDPRHQVFI